MGLPQEADEPLVLADGTQIDPKNGQVVKKRRAAFVEVPAPSVAQALVVKARKSVSDLPAPPAQLTGVALVAFYTLFGLSDQDIALAVDSQLTTQQIANIRKLDVYTEFMDAARTNIVETSTNQVREVFQQHAASAAHTIVELAAGEDDVLAFKASQDILDRAGHRPADIIEHRHKLEDALHIVITERDGAQQLPIVDLTPERTEYEDV